MWRGRKKDFYILAEKFQIKRSMHRSKCSNQSVSVGWKKYSKTRRFVKYILELFLPADLAGQAAVQQSWCTVPCASSSRPSSNPACASIILMRNKLDQSVSQDLRHHCGVVHCKCGRNKETWWEGTEWRCGAGKCRKGSFAIAFQRCKIKSRS
jgi:hypothetical protein